MLALIAALLLAYPSTPHRACLVARRDPVAAELSRASAQTGVLPELILSVGWSESAASCDRRAHGGWGAARPGALPAARILAAGLARCGTTRGAVSYFRSGVCAPGRHARYVAAVTRLVARLSR